jgi:hypothetical protein
MDRLQLGEGTTFIRQMADVRPIDTGCNGAMDPMVAKVRASATAADSQTEARII